jgi:hypothetical protein
MAKYHSQFNTIAHFFSLSISISLSAIAVFITGCNFLEPTSAPSSTSQAASTTPIVQQPAYVRPTKADNGAPFPKKSGYIKNYPVRFTDGYSSVTVDNSRNNSDVFVKLYSQDANLAKPIRVFFIRAYDRFTAETVRAGRYDVRYQDLNSGGLSATESFDLQEINTGTGIESSRVKLTLYKVKDGNMKPRPISKDEFK